MQHFLKSRISAHGRKSIYFILKTSFYISSFFLNHILLLPPTFYPSNLAEGHLDLTCYQRIVQGKTSGCLRYYSKAATLIWPGYRLEMLCSVLFAASYNIPLTVKKEEQFYCATMHERFGPLKSGPTLSRSVQQTNLLSHQGIQD